MGSGGPSSIYPRWANDYSSNAFLLKYFASSDSAGLQDIQEFNVDFAAVASRKLLLN